MGFQDLGPVLGGLLKSSADQRDINREDAVRQQAREDSVFHALANSEDPDVRAAAVTGLLHNDHPGTIFEKFFQKHQANPAFENIKSLVANGHQPFKSESAQIHDKAYNTAYGQLTGDVGAINDAGTAAGLSPDQRNAAIMGKLGAAPRQSPNNGLQEGAFYDQSGKFSGNGYRDPANRTWFSSDNQPVTDPNLRFVPKGANPNGAGKSGAPPDPNKIVWDPGVRADTGQFPGEHSVGGWRTGHKPDGTPVHDSAFQSQSFSFVPTNQGVATGNTRTGGLSVSPAGAALTSPTPPAAASSALQGLVARLERNKPQHGLLATSPPSAAQMARWQADADAAAKAQGFGSYAELQAAAGEATRGVSAGVAPAVSGASSPTGPPPVPPGGGAARGKTAAPAKGTSAPPAGAGTGTPDRQHFINSVLDQLPR